MKHPKSVTQDHMIATFLINDISRMCRQVVDREMRKIGLTRAQWYILNFIYLYEGATQQELADLIDLGKSAVGKQVATLQDRGWVYKGNNENDARSFRVYLTEHMKPAVVRLNKFVELVLAPALGPLKDHEVPSLIYMLRSLDSQIEDLLSEPRAAVDAMRDEIEAEIKNVQPQSR